MWFGARSIAELPSVANELRRRENVYAERPLHAGESRRGALGSTATRKAEIDR